MLPIFDRRVKPQYCSFKVKQGHRRTRPGGAYDWKARTGGEGTVPSRFSPHKVFVFFTASRDGVTALLVSPEKRPAYSRRHSMRRHINPAAGAGQVWYDAAAMLKAHSESWLLEENRLTEDCPHCGAHTQLVQTTEEQLFKLFGQNVPEIIVGYSCQVCDKAIPVLWDYASGNTPSEPGQVANPRSILRSVENFDFDVPEAVASPIKESLDCLSVSAFNGFAAVVRRALQAICEDKDSSGSKLYGQLKDLFDGLQLEAEDRQAAEQIMLTGHDGAHPQLPDVTKDRAYLVLELLRDFVDQVYQRPGRIKAAKELRLEGIKEKKASDSP